MQLLRALVPTLLVTLLALSAPGCGTSGGAAPTTGAADETGADETGVDETGATDTVVDETGATDTVIDETGATDEPDEVCAAGEPCDDGDLCTVDDVCDGEGGCAGEPMVCEGDEARPCVLFACDEETGLCAGSLAEGTCLIDDTCLTEGDAAATTSCLVCAPEEDAIGWSPAVVETACDDGDLCTTGDVCDDGGACAGEPMVCDDGEPCTNDVCVEGECETEAVEDALPCDDGDPCTVEVACASGDCVGVPMTCDDHDPCTTDACVDGECVYTPVSDGTACDDGDACTLDDACVAQTCGGEPMVCDDEDECTTDACDPHTAACAFDPIVGCGENVPPAFSLQDLNPYSASYLTKVALGDFTGFLVVVAFHSAS